MNFMFFVFIGNAPSQQPPCRQCMTRHGMHERMQVESTSEEPLENEDMDIDDLIKNWKAKRMPKKMMMYNIIIRQINVLIASILGTYFGL